jgi:hypothetical protein
MWYSTTLLPMSQPQCVDVSMQVATRSVQSLRRVLSVPMRTISQAIALRKMQTKMGHHTPAALEPGMLLQTRSSESEHLHQWKSNKHKLQNRLQEQQRQLTISRLGMWRIGLVFWPPRLAISSATNELLENNTLKDLSPSFLLSLEEAEGRGLRHL